MTTENWCPGQRWFQIQPQSVLLGDAVKRSSTPVQCRAGSGRFGREERSKIRVRTSGGIPGPKSRTINLDVLGGGTRRQNPSPSVNAGPHDHGSLPLPLIASDALTIRCEEDLLNRLLSPQTAGVSGAGSRVRTMR